MKALVVVPTYNEADNIASFSAAILALSVPLDILIVDELWAISEATYFGALKPSQIAVPSPLAFLVSTAGDESSRAFLKLREQALGVIDSGERSDLFMAEWSLETGVSPDDQKYWGQANPSLGRTITLKGLQAAAESPDRAQFLRAHCNLWSLQRTRGLTRANGRSVIPQTKT